MSLQLKKIKEEFPQLGIPVRNNRLIYLDNAATTLMPRGVSEGMARHDLYSKANVHRGAHYWSDFGTTAYEQAREKVAGFIGAETSAEVIFTRGTTESLNLIARTLVGSQFQPGDGILITEMEHHSNIVPWQMLAQERGLLLHVAPVTDQGELDLEAMRELLKKNIKLVSLVYCSNALGTINPISEIVAMAKEVGAYVVVDAAQSVALMPTNVQELGCDFLAFSGHKLFGPFGIGVLWGRRDLLETMPPYQGGGSMISTVTFTHTDFLPPPQRFEAGTPNVTGAIGLGLALDYLKQLDWRDIADHERSLLHLARRQLQTVSGLRWVGESPTAVSIVSFVIDGTHASDIGQILDQQGIAVRTGHHCTQPLLRRFGVTSTVRASFSIYNDESDVEALVAGIQKARELLT